MDVAIIGAGISGLSCAYELEKYGIYPVIYESNSFIGEQIDHVAAILTVLSDQSENLWNTSKTSLESKLSP
jgi:digeranylgeranylglycerophospholipid reductase